VGGTSTGKGEGGLKTLRGGGVLITVMGPFTSMLCRGRLLSGKWRSTRRWVSVKVKGYRGAELGEPLSAKEERGELRIEFITLIYLLNMKPEPGL